MPFPTRKWITQQDGLDKLRLDTDIVPDPGPREVVVKVEAVALNYRDIEVCTGTYGFEGDDSCDATLTPCSDMAGKVVVAGANSIWRPGDAVISTFNQTHLTGPLTPEIEASGLGLPLEGVLAEYVRFPDEGIVAKPEYLSFEEAATLPIAAVTAWMALQWLRPLGQPRREEGHVVLVQGTGGVAVFALQLAKAAGMTAIVTSSSDEKLAKATHLGADHIINYATNSDWHTTVLALTNGHGADTIIENGGPATIAKSFECVAYGGCISCVGYLSGKGPDSTNVNVLTLRRNVTVKGIWNGPRDRFEELLGFVEEVGVRPVLDQVVGFEEAGMAMGWLEGGGHFGKVVVRVG